MFLVEQASKLDDEQLEEILAPISHRPDLNATVAAAAFDESAISNVTLDVTRSAADYDDDPKTGRREARLQFDADMARIDPKLFSSSDAHRDLGNFVLSIEPLENFKKYAKTFKEKENAI